MTAFLLVATALAAATVVGLVWPLLRRVERVPAADAAAASAAVLRDQLAELEQDYAAGALPASHYEEAREELRRRALEDAADAPRAAQDLRSSRAAWTVGIAVPLAAALVYAWVGTPAALVAPPPSIGPRDIVAMVDRLARRLAEQPDDLDGWLMLARSYRVLGQHAEAAAAFDRAGARANGEARWLAEWAESLAVANGGLLAGRPAELVARALALDPEHAHARALAGAVAFEAGDHASAIAHWEQILPRLPGDSQEAEALRRSIAAARERLARDRLSPPR